MNLVTYRPAVRRPRTVATTPKAFRPQVNILETADDFRLELAAPGWRKKDFDVQLENDQLIISAERTEDTTEGTTYLRREFRPQTFTRRFTLSDAVDTTNVKATFKNGLLVLTLAKKEEAKEQPPRKVTVA